ncbi:TPA: 3'-5' exoribonuclease domain-containing protein [Serratia fonticola]
MVSAQTQQWWQKQEEETHEALASKREPLSQGLVNLTAWIQQHPDASIFFRGTDLDGSLLENAYRTWGLTCPWHFAGKRDVRTYNDTMVKGTKGYLLRTYQPCIAMAKYHSLAEQMAIAYQSCVNAIVSHGCI